ncbi:Alpha/Beta hydrolase protein [Trichoderma velutinum]
MAYEIAEETSYQEGFPRAAAPNFTDHVFLSRSGVELAVRIWPADPPTSSPAPFATWTHGGAAMAGHHFTPLTWMEPGLRQRGFHIVSHNYRLSPQARIDEQLEDCLEAIEWCRTNLPVILGCDRVDVNRYIICGESAGGVMVTLMAHHLSPPPKAVINAYGIVDFLGNGVNLLDPNAHNISDLHPWTGEFEAERLKAYLYDRNPANILTDALFWDEREKLSEADLSLRLKTDFKYTERIRFQAELHKWKSICFSSKGMIQATFHDEKFSSSSELKKFIDSMCSIRLLEGKTWYPPTVLLHGTSDSIVPLSQSQAFANKLREMDVPVIESYEPGAGHVFDDKYTSILVEGWDAYIQPVLNFVNIHINK